MKRGQRAAVICSEPFEKLGRAQAKTFGVPDSAVIVIPHPLGGVGLEQVRMRADAAWEQLAKIITETSK